VLDDCSKSSKIQKVTSITIWHFEVNVEAEFEILLSTPFPFTSMVID